MATNKFVLTRQEAIDALQLYLEEDFSHLSNAELEEELCSSGTFAELTAGKDVYEEDLTVV